MAKPTNENTASKVYALSKQGMPPRQIAKLLNIHQTSVSSWQRKLRSAGHEIPYPKKGRPAVDLTSIIKEIN
jgi:transposase